MKPAQRGRHSKLLGSREPAGHRAGEAPTRDAPPCFVHRVHSTRPSLRQRRDQQHHHASTTAGGGGGGGVDESHPTDATLFLVTRRAARLEEPPRAVVIVRPHVREFAVFKHSGEVALGHVDGTQHPAPWTPVPPAEFGAPVPTSSEHHPSTPPTTVDSASAHEVSLGSPTNTSVTQLYENMPPSAVSVESSVASTVHRGGRGRVVSTIDQSKQEIAAVAVGSGMCWALTTTGQCMGAPTERARAQQGTRQRLLTLMPMSAACEASRSASAKVRLEVVGGFLCAVAGRNLFVASVEDENAMAMDVPLFAGQAGPVDLSAEGGCLTVGFYDSERRECVEVEVQRASSDDAAMNRKTTVPAASAYPLHMYPQLRVELADGVEPVGREGVITGVSRSGLPFVVSRGTDPLMRDRGVLSIHHPPSHVCPPLFTTPGVSPVKGALNSFKFDLLTPGQFPELGRASRVVICCPNVESAADGGTPLAVLAEVSGSSGKVAWWKMSWTEIGTAKRKARTPIAFCPAMGADTTAPEKQQVNIKVAALVGPRWDSRLKGTTVLEMFAFRAAKDPSKAADAAKSPAKPGVFQRFINVLRGTNTAAGGGGAAAGASSDAAVVGGSGSNPGTARSGMSTARTTDSTVTGRTTGSDAETQAKLTKPFPAVSTRFSIDHVIGIRGLSESSAPMSGGVRSRFLVWSSHEVYVVTVPKQLPWTDPTGPAQSLHPINTSELSSPWSSMAASPGLSAVTLQSTAPSVPC